MIGRIATTLGNEGINIERMAVAQDKSNKRNIILLATDTSINDIMLNKLGNLENVFSVKKIEL
jgi:predicted regulator of amino acid metabolism with ACT domain